MRLSWFTHRFLEGLAETVDSLNSEVSPAPFNPRVAVLSALILTGVAAFSRDSKTPLLMLSVSVMLVSLTYFSVLRWAKILIPISGWAIVVSAPLPFIIPGEPLANLPPGSIIELKVSYEGFNAMVEFVLRVVASAAVFTSFASILGWRRTVLGLKALRMPKELAFLLNLSVIHIPLFLREASKMLSAREARVMRKTTFKELWKMTATVVGDLLIRGHERAWKLEKAIKARMFQPEFRGESTSPPLGIKDLLLLSLTLCILALRVLGWL